MTWKRLLPDSIAGRTTVVLLAGLLLSHAVALAIYAGDRIAALAAFGGAQTAERIATVARTIESAPLHERGRLARGMNGPDLRVNWSSEPLVASEATDGRARAIVNQLRDRLGTTAAIRVAVRENGIVPPAEGPRMKHRMGGMMGERGEGPFGYGWHSMMRGLPARVLVSASVRSGDGGWVNVMAPIEPTESLWSPRFVLALSVLVVAAIGLSAWAARRTLRPLATFAGAARRLGVDVNAPPVDAAGPREVREAAEAFNEMQRRLGDLIAGRTQTLAAISHDLRTPITRLRLRLEFVGDAEQRTKFEADLEEMEKMIAAALALARDEAAVEARTRIDLSALLAGLVADARALGQDAEYRGPARLDIAAAPISLKRAFANLIDNAVRYGWRARVTLNAEGGRARVDVEDDGPGIPESEQAKVFQPFYRLERSRSRDTGGTGLGLAVARTAVLAHGGSIALRNRAGGGLTVSVALPT